MDPKKLIDTKSYVVALVVLILGFFLFFSDTFEFLKSFGAAILLAALVWISYIMVRLLILALRK
jgi:hypothetical protein